MKMHSRIADSKLADQLDICIGKDGTPVGQLNYVKDGFREFSSFAYADSWLTNPDRFIISPDQELAQGWRTRKATKSDSCFPFALADTEPDAWGRRVIARSHAKLRVDHSELRALTEIDYLCAVDDFSRIGALRLRDVRGNFLAKVEDGKRATPPVVELGRLYNASRAVERGVESADDLRYLQGKGTSLGGMRPKCTIIDSDGMLAIGKFPSINDQRDVTRGEILAMKLAQLAGINVASARITSVDDVAIAVISRFDRTPDFGRIPYLSAGSMLQASKDDEHAYTEIVDVINSTCLSARQDSQQLWRRIVFNHLITNVDDHLHNLGFLHVGNGLWRLAPAFDLNPFPDKDRESKTWLSEESGPVTSISTLLKEADRFYLTPSEAMTVLNAVLSAITNWETVATSTDVGLTEKDLADFVPAFEHDELEAAKKLLKNS